MANEHLEGGRRDALRAPEVPTGTVRRPHALRRMAGPLLSQVEVGPERPQGLSGGIFVARKQPAAPQFTAQRVHGARAVREAGPDDHRFVHAQEAHRVQVGDEGWRENGLDQPALMEIGSLAKPARAERRASDRMQDCAKQRLHEHPIANPLEDEVELSDGLARDDVAHGGIPIGGTAPFRNGSRALAREPVREEANGVLVEAVGEVERAHESAVEGVALHEGGGGAGQVKAG